VSNLRLTSASRFETIGLSGAVGTTITSGAANTEGSWSSTIGTPSFDWDGFFLTVYGGTGSGRMALLDIGIGSTPDVVLSDLIVHTSVYLNTFHIPIRMPAGLAVKMRHQCNAASNPAVVSLTGYRGDQAGIPGFSRGEQIPALNAGSYPDTSLTQTGTSVTAWTPIKLSADRNYGALLPQFSLAGDATRTGGYVQAEIGKGASGLETTFCTFATRNDALVGLPNMPVIPARVAAGDRLSWRVTCSAAGLVDSMALGLIGFW
jgi:hypothetical protein